MTDDAHLPDARAAVVWFRRDLRLHDHPAMTAAAGAATTVVPLFVFDDALLRGRWPAPNRTWFMRESALRLDEELRAAGSRLVWRSGRPEHEVLQVAQAAGAALVVATRDHGPYARRRDARVAAALAAHGIAFQLMPGLLIHEPERVLTRAGEPFTVYSRFRALWSTLGVRAVLPPVTSLAPLPTSVEAGSPPELSSFGIGPPEATGILEPGEAAARDRLARWLAGGIDDYRDSRNDLSRDGTSRLSQDLHWGLLSPVEVASAAASMSGAGPAAFNGELAWRDFFSHVLWHFPEVTQRSFQRQYDAIEHTTDPSIIDAWRDGQTGYPLVDAAMRQVRALGWMHNRARMVVASFLTKDLLVDWRAGERFFMEHLVDGGLASNNGGWQWAASTGTDAQPYFRIFNPVLQAKRFDPDGRYVRHWLPELAGVPDAWIFEPWTMPEGVQAAAGCLIGRDYPEPIVDHGAARARALDAYVRAKAAGRPRRE